MRGRVALVTGASSGIGWSVAETLARRGARVMAIAHRADRLDALASETGVAAFAVSLDSEDGCALAVRETEARLGPVDLLVTCAGIGSNAEAEVWNEPPAVWSETMRINLDAPFHLTRLATAGMVERGFGRVVHVSSTAGVMGGARMPAYCASKHGVIGLTRAAALDLAPHGVTVNAVLPGWVRTEMAERSAAAEAERRSISAEQVWDERERSYAAGRIPTAEEVAETIAWLCSDEASGVSGQTVAVTLGDAW
ncbi:MAG TPA: SDR family oxidoreductase [Gaiellales bacterium]|nr:SDR family oxidoreductase [Gaiellales bacterium]